MKHNKRQNRAAAIITLLAASLLVTACNTVKGLGRDIESIGQSGEDAIN